MFNPLQASMDGLKMDWEAHKNELTDLRRENKKLTKKVEKFENITEGLRDRIKWLENKLLENSLIFRGISESTWESEEVCREKMINVLARIVPKDQHDE